MPGCLVLASKEVGLACLKHIVSLNENIVHVFAGSTADEDIIALCRKNNIPCSLTSREALQQFVEKGKKADWLLNFWSPHILSPDILAMAKRRLNVHPGLVPHCKGNDAAAWCIRKSLPAGVSLIEMDASVDTGRVYAQKEVAYGSTDTGKTLHLRLIEEAIALFVRDWASLRDGKREPAPQQSGGSYFTRKQTNADRIKAEDEKMTLGELATWARAHDFTPGTTAEIVMHDGTRYTVQVEKIEKQEDIERSG